MKTKQLLVSLFLMFVGMASAVAQVKVGANPGSIGSGSSLEVEATNGKKLIVDKTDGSVTVQSLSAGSASDSVMTFDANGKLTRMSLGRLAKTLSTNYASSAAATPNSGVGQPSVGTCPGLDYVPNGIASVAPATTTLAGVSGITVTKINTFTANAAQGGHVYALYQTGGVTNPGINWVTAYNFARSVGGTLPIITSGAEWAYLRASVLPSAASNIWIGYRKFEYPGNATQFNWIDCQQSNFNYSTFTYDVYWRSGEPNNSGSTEGCGHIVTSAADPTNRGWNDATCSAVNAFGTNTNDYFIYIIVEFNQ